MAARVRVLRAEGGSERIDVRERETIRLDVELSRHREKCFPPEEILPEIDLPFVITGQVHQVEYGYPEQGSGPFRIRGGNDRRIDPEEPAFAEEPVDGLRERMAHARRGADHIGARSKVGDLAQKFQGVMLGLNRIGIRIVDPANDLDRFGLHFELLAFPGGRNDRTDGLDGAAGGEPRALRRVVWISDPAD